MAKEKKITVKFYLNKIRKAKEKADLSINGNSEPIKLYPVYVRLIFNKNNTQFKLSLANVETVLYPLEAEKLGIENYPPYKKEILKKKRMIEDVVRREVNYIGVEKYSFINIAYRIEQYDKTITSELNKFLIANLDNLHSLYLIPMNFFKVVNETNPFAKIKLAEKLAGQKIKIPAYMESIILIMFLLVEEKNHSTLYEWNIRGEKNRFMTYIKGYSKYLLENNASTICIENEHGEFEIDSSIVTELPNIIINLSRVMLYRNRIIDFED